jgi:hypothetical protein
MQHSSDKCFSRSLQHAVNVDTNHRVPEFDALYVAHCFTASTNNTL